MPHARQNSYSSSCLILSLSTDSSLVKDKPSVEQQQTVPAVDMKRINSCSGILESFSVAAWLEEVSDCNTTPQSQPTIIPPAHKALVLRSADAYASQGNYAQAVKLYTHALDMVHSGEQDAFGSAAGVNGSGIYYSRALCYFNMNKLQKALGDLDCAISREPISPKLYQLRGNVFLLLSRQQLAALDYIRASELETANALQQEERKARQQIISASEIKPQYNWNIASLAAFCITCTTSMIVLWCC